MPPNLSACAQWLAANAPRASSACALDQQSPRAAHTHPLPPSPPQQQISPPPVAYQRPPPFESSPVAPPSFAAQHIAASPPFFRLAPRARSSFPPPQPPVYSSPPVVPLPKPDSVPLPPFCRFAVCAKGQSSNPVAPPVPSPESPSARCVPESSPSKHCLPLRRCSVPPSRSPAPFCPRAQGAKPPPSPRWHFWQSPNPALPFSHRDCSPKPCR